ncbi:tRNA1(Val) (adenine(37)-N6)-methyltransferase [Varunaivibrio sulfuroxidans]|uniref:tRNA1(Val) A37 N6-methylase TrmN6 n=1 Tax=Varunaivibrio sulfuroxidans TaxID=1773489 RepID=A0A4R3JAG6_9PROT|nr:methyltransferase [Varunaivibrio sulfuroxidans]TCS62622.1 tRNA1(Val) A37 N6-methylase TrmN6 [Varunaivibrio sulfuroxidans]WES30711.1 methyltransferase [Varunaivibrio sulfuroxidans]
MNSPGANDPGLDSRDSPASCEIPEEVSDDALLGGRVRLLQPLAGYRAAIDPVLLAAAIAPRSRARVLDAGMGVGAAALCLARRVADITVTGIELQEPLAALARRNIALNGVQGRVDVVLGDIAAPPDAIARGGFDHVMVNPPYMERGQGHPPPETSRAAAHVEGRSSLDDWVKFALAMTKTKGDVTFVHRADRLDDVLAALHGRAGAITVLPIRSRSGRQAKRVIVRARKGVSGPLQLLSALIVHDAGGGYTSRAQDILQEARALNFRDFC